MTGWQDVGPEGAQPLTRRQLRERERLLERQRSLEEAAPLDGPERQAPAVQPEGAGTEEPPSAPRNPSYDGPSFRNRPVPPTSVETAPEPDDANEPAGYRMRDYGPPAARVSAAESPLTRRQLRALQEARLQRSQATVVEARDEADAADRSRTDTPDPLHPVAGEPVGSPTPEPVDPSTPDAVDSSDSEQPSSTVEPVDPSSAEPVDSPNPAILVLESDDAERPDHPASHQPPAGHWSVQDGNNDNISTTSIVMPVVPNHNDMQQALNSTGEIIITGSIDMPRSFGATGAHPERYDSSEIDRLLDAADGRGESLSDSAPVRASRAVSTHASTRAVVHGPPRRRISLPVVLASTGGVLIVGVGTLLYFAFGLGF